MSKGSSIILEGYEKYKKNNVNKNTLWGMSI